jgi:hypothetical protein
MAGRLTVDRERFAWLVGALAGGGVACASCAHPPATTAGAQPPAVDAPTVATVDVPAATPSLASTLALPSTPEAAPAPAPTDACVAQNDEGTVDCARIDALSLPPGPACEGVKDLCQELGDGTSYRRRAAQHAVECMSRLGRRVCDIRARKRCYEEGVRAACPEARFAETCADALEKCAQAHLTPTYTQEDCQRALSALAPPEATWAAGAMGPSHEGKCELMFTVY